MRETNRESVRRPGPPRLHGFDYTNSDAVYSVTVCTSNRMEKFKDAALAEKVVESLHWLRVNRGVRIYAYCLMPDHLHLLMRLGPGGFSLGDVIGAMKKFTTRESWTLGYEGALWQEQFYDHILRSSESAADIGEYIRQNPVRNGLVTDPDEYPWSGYPDPM